MISYKTHGLCLTFSDGTWVIIFFSPFGPLICVWLSSQSKKKKKIAMTCLKPKTKVIIMLSWCYVSSKLAILSCNLLLSSPQIRPHYLFHLNLPWVLSQVLGMNFHNLNNILFHSHEMIFTQGVQLYYPPDRGERVQQSRQKSKAISDISSYN